MTFLLWRVQNGIFTTTTSTRTKERKEQASMTQCARIESAIRETYFLAFLPVGYLEWWWLRGIIFPNCDFSKEFEY